MKRLEKHLRKEKLLDPSQGAFQQHKSSLDQASFLCQKIQDSFNVKETTLTVFFISKQRIHFKTKSDRKINQNENSKRNY